MTGTEMMRNPKNFLDMKWSPMIVLSFIFHVGVISVTLFLPQSIPGAGRFQGMVYEVDLVEMPAKGGPSLGKKPTTTGSKEKNEIKKATKAKKVTIPKKKRKTGRYRQTKSQKEDPDQRKTGGFFSTID